MNILISGGTGNLGKHIVDRLQAEGHSLTLLTRSENLQNNDEKNCYIYLDLTKSESIEIFDQYDAFLHLAWEVLPQYTNHIHLSSILKNHLSLISYIIENNIAKKIVCIGSCLEYGKLYGEIDEDQGCFPNTPYGAAKDLLRRHLFKLSVENTIPAIWIRLFYLDDGGKNQRSILGKIVETSISKNNSLDVSHCTQQIDYIKLDKAVAGIVKIINHPFSGNHIFNMSSGKPAQLKDFLQQFIADNQLNISLNYGEYPMAEYESDYYWGCANKLEDLK